MTPSIVDLMAALNRLAGDFEKLSDADAWTYDFIYHTDPPDWWAGIYQNREAALQIEIAAMLRQAAIALKDGKTGHLPTADEVFGILADD